MPLCTCCPFGTIASFRLTLVGFGRRRIDCRGGFTKDAETEARTQEKRRGTLIGLEKLFDLWDEHYDKLTDQARRRLPLRSIRFLAPGG